MINLIFEIIIIILLALIGHKIPSFEKKLKIDKIQRHDIDTEEVPDDIMEQVINNQEKKPKNGLDKLVSMDWKYKGVN